MSAQADARLRSLIDDIVDEMRASRLEIKRVNDQLLQLRKDVMALNAFRLALESKTWEHYHRRHVGRVKAGVARAASGMRDAHGRYVSG